MAKLLFFQASPNSSEIPTQAAEELLECEELIVNCAPDALRIKSHFHVEKTRRQAQSSPAWSDQFQFFEVSQPYHTGTAPHWVFPSSFSWHLSLVGQTIMHIQNHSDKDTMSHLISTQTNHVECMWVGVNMCKLIMFFLHTKCFL